MSEPIRMPRPGDIVLYHETVRDDLWDPSHNVVWPAIVTAILPAEPGPSASSVRLTVFRPYERPLWDVTAHHWPTPRARCWSWPEDEVAPG